MPAFTPPRSRNQHIVDWILPFLLGEADGSEPWHWMRANMLASVGDQCLRAQLQQRCPAFSEQEAATLNDLESLLNVLFRHELLVGRSPTWEATRSYAMTRDWPLVQRELKRLMPLVDALL